MIGQDTTFVEGGTGLRKDLTVCLIEQGLLQTQNIMPDLVINASPVPLSQQIGLQDL